MLVHFYNTKPFFIIFVGNSLDAGGLSRAGVPEKQTVVGFSPLHKGQRVFNQLFLWNLVAHQIVQMNVGDIPNGNDFHPAIPVDYTESLVETELPDSVIPVKLRQGILHFLRHVVFRELHRQTADSVPDTAVVHLAFAVRAFITGNQVKRLKVQCPRHFRKVKIKELLENHNIMEYRPVNGAPYLSPDFTGPAVAVFIVHQQIGKITVPQIPVESMVFCHLKKPVHTTVTKKRCLLSLCFLPVMRHQPRHIIQKFSLFPGKLLIHNQFFLSHLSPFPCVCCLHSSFYPRAVLSPARLPASIISQNPHISGFFPKPPQRVFHRAVREIPVKVNKETVFPVPPLYGSALDSVHIQIIINEMGQHMIEGTALMGNLKTNADFSGVFQKDFLIRHDNKSCGIGAGLVDALLKHGKSVKPRRVFAGNGRL